MHSIETEFIKQRWFKVEKIQSDRITRSKYVPLEKLSGCKTYYKNYFEASDPQIKYIINKFRTKPTSFAEIAATLFACFMEISETQQEFSERNLLSKFYAWSEQKMKYQEKQVLDMWKWLIEERIVQVFQ
jgi:type I restriction enzyme S subunit/type I restriction enzyme M protein